jgi:serine/threonine-protein kinase
MNATEQTEGIEALARRVTIGEIVRHGGIPPVLDAELDRAPFFVVEPWVGGRCLTEWVKSHASPHPAQSIWILRQLAEILHSAHHHDRAHLRVNPRRVVINEVGQVTLLGWGKSQAFGKLTAAEIQVAEEEAWRAPETWSRDYVAQPAADVYSLGLLMYWLLAGHHPLERGGRAWEQTQKTVVPDWSAWPGTYSGNLKLLTERMLAKNPLRRPLLSAVLNELVAGEIDHLSNSQRI